MAGSFKYLFFGLSFFLLFLVFPISFAAAEGDITLLVGVEEQHSDNFYRTPADETSVYTTIIKPGITASTWTNRSSLLFAYSPTFNYYSGDSNGVDASDDDFVGHDLSLVAETTLSERLRLSLTEIFQDTREPGAYDALLAAESDRERYSNNQLRPFLTYDFGEKFTAILGYQHQAYNYKDSRNSHEHRGYFTLRYHLNDRNSLELEEQYWSRGYATEPDYDSSQTKLIFRRAVSDFLNYEIGAGYHDRNFESGATGVEDYDDLIYRVALTGESDVSKLFLGFQKNLNDFSKRASWYFEAQRFTLSVEHTFVEKLTCTLATYYQKNDYETIIPPYTEVRDDEIWDGFVGVRYKIRDWISAGLSFEHTDRDSNISEWNYTENRVFANIRCEYSTAMRW
jgi:hypothetical protein